jgi:hypothetical protein
MDDFEQQLQRRPMRPVPAEWRADILSAAKAVSDTQHETRNTQSLAMKLWQELIWPCRRVWLGIAAIWFVVLACNMSMDDSPKVVASQTPPPTPEMMAALREQKQLLVQLLEPVASSPPPPAAAPRPRSEKQQTVMLG